MGDNLSLASVSCFSEVEIASYPNYPVNKVLIYIRTIGILLSIYLRVHMRYEENESTLGPSNDISTQSLFFHIFVHLFYILLPLAFPYRSFQFSVWHAVKQYSL